MAEYGKHINFCPKLPTMKMRTKKNWKSWTRKNWSLLSAFGLVLETMSYDELPFLAENQNRVVVFGVFPVTFGYAFPLLEIHVECWSAPEMVTVDGIVDRQVFVCGLLVNCDDVPLCAVICFGVLVSCVGVQLLGFHDHVFLLGVETDLAYGEI